MQKAKRLAGDFIFGMGFALTCALLVPVCLLLVCVYGVFTAAGSISLRLGGQKAKGLESPGEEARLKEGNGP